MSGLNVKARSRTALRRWRLLPRGYQDGQSAVELALLAPVLVIILLVLIDLGRLFYLSIEVNGAARAGVQYGAQSPATAVDNAGMVQAAKKDANEIANKWWGTATNFNAFPTHFCQCSDGSASTCAAGACATQQFTFVQVDTVADFKPLSKYIGLPTSITLHGKAIMRASNG